MKMDKKELREMVLKQEFEKAKENLAICCTYARNIEYYEYIKKELEKIEQRSVSL